MKFYALTDIGKRRSLNEDSYCLPAEGEDFCAVADGMGGHNAGEVASALAVNVFAERMRAGGEITEEKMAAAVKSANRSIYKRSESESSCKGMGTTFTALAAEKNRIMIAHVGDSMCFQLRGGKIKKITHDHSYVQELVDAGRLTPMQAMVSPYRNYITRAVGTHENVQVDTFTLTARPGDVYLLCSDGLANHVKPDEMLKISCLAISWPEKLRQLIKAALDDGGTDNITAVYAVYMEEDK